LYSERVFGLEGEARLGHGSRVRVVVKKLLLILSIGLVLPGVAEAGTVVAPNVTMVSRDVAVGSRSLAAAAAPIRFDMLGLHWQGRGSVAYRTRSLAGRWSAWKPADADLPQTKPPWHFGNLDWTGEAVAAQFRTDGVTRLRAYYLSSRVTSAPKRSLSVAGSPAIVPRTDWQADEKIVRAHPLYAPTLKLAVVHHTAGTNAYTPAEAPAIVRGIELYHVKGNGWNDIGYNFLVDRYGTVYEGRGGGMTRNVIGAHALGFNTGTVGVSLIGNFQNATPPPAMQAALVSLLAWRLDVAHLDPLSTVAYTSGGNGKFRAGKVVTLRAISGHRDTGPSECPGNIAYALLPSVASRVAATGLPKLYAPVVSGVLGGNVRFQARLSSSLPWSVTVTNAKGTVVGRKDGNSQLVDWSWSSAAAGKGPFAWTIASGKDVLPATGTLGGKLTVPAPAPSPPPPPANLISGLTASPSVLTTTAESTLVTAIDFALSRQAQLTVTVGSLQLLSTTAAAGNDHFEWDLSQLPDGRYKLVVTAKAGGATSSQAVDIVVDRTLSGLVATPNTFSPNADGSSDTVAFNFSLSQNVPVQVSVQRAGAVVATLFVGQLGPGPQTVGWDGTSAGVRLPDGQYTAVVTATDSLATVSLLVPFAVDTVAPALTVVNGSALQFQLTEPGTVSGTINGQPVSATEPAGTFTFPSTGVPVTSWSLQAKDAAGNTSPVVSGP
jgi:flagellar hook assembly protein FlgD